MRGHEAMVVGSAHSTSGPRSTRGLGISLVVTAFLFTVAVAAVPSGHSWSTLVSVVLVLIAGALQFGAAFVFDRSGRADPTLARVAVGSLLRLVSQTKRARIRAENALTGGDENAMRTAMGMLSVELSFIEEGVSDAAQAWAAFHPEAISRLAEEVQKHESVEESVE